MVGNPCQPVFEPYPEPSRKQKSRPKCFGTAFQADSLEYVQAFIFASMAAMTERFCSSSVGLRMTGAGLTFKLRRRLAALERTLSLRVEKPDAITY